MKRLVPLLLAVAMICGCLTVSFADTAEKTTFTFITPSDNEPASLNQLKGGTGDYFNNQYLLGAPLFRYKNGVIENELCTDYDVSADGLTYTLNLREAKYSDGVEITATDFVFMMKSYLDPDNGVTLGSTYMQQHILNGRAFFYGECSDFAEVGFKALDEHTLEITLDEPNPNLISTLASNIFCPLREDVLAEFGDAMGSQPDKMVYSGPYCLTEWTSGTTLVMEKNPMYWNAENAFPVDKIVHLLVGDSNTAYSLYEAGQADAIVNLDSEYVDLLGDDVQIADGNRLEMIWMNTSGISEETSALMGNVNFRKALHYSLNREAIVAAIAPTNEAYTRYTSPWHMDADGNYYVDDFTVDCAPTAGDLEAAKAYLATALTELGYASVDELPTLQYVTYENQLLKVFSETIIDQWKQLLGLKNIEFTPYPIGTALDKIYGCDFDFFCIGNDMGSEAQGLYDAFAPGGDYDFPCWSGEEFEAFRAAYDQLKGKTGAEYIEALKNTEQAFADACFIVPIFRHNNVHAVKPYVDGMTIAIVGKGYIFDELTVNK